MLAAFLRALPVGCQPVQALRAVLSLSSLSFMIGSFWNLSFVPFWEHILIYLMLDLLSAHFSSSHLIPQPSFISVLLGLVFLSFSPSHFPPSLPVKQRSLFPLGITWHIFCINENSLLPWVGSMSSYKDFKLQGAPIFQFILLLSRSRGWGTASFVTEVQSTDLESLTRYSTHRLICLGLYNAEHASHFPSVFGLIPTLPHRVLLGLGICKLHFPGSLAGWLPVGICQ